MKRLTDQLKFSNEKEIFNIIKSNCDDKFVNIKNNYMYNESASLTKQCWSTVVGTLYGNPIVSKELSPDLVQTVAITKSSGFYTIESYKSLIIRALNLF